MLSILRTTLSKLPVLCTSQPLINNGIALFHTLLKPRQFTETSRLLAPIITNVVPSCGFKVKGLLRRRCKDCYFVVRQERLYVICKTHPRHKQMSMVTKPKNTWIITHATQGKLRPW